jgi:hypothetical protein
MDDEVTYVELTVPEANPEPRALGRQELVFC